MEYRDSSVSGKKWSHSGYILKVELPRFANILEVKCQGLRKGFGLNTLEEWELTVFERGKTVVAGLVLFLVERGRGGDKKSVASDISRVPLHIIVERGAK